MVRKSSFDSEGYLPGSVLTFIAVVDPHTSTVTMCSRSPKFFSGQAENGTTYLNPLRIVAALPSILSCQYYRLKLRYLSVASNPVLDDFYNCA